ncbi:hypothetical protein RHJ63_08310 [Thermosynechococcus sp. JY1334]|uniref:hypothetical protein n=1 Tax=unclassified Thermosynechococcus TaxID=2622553 RepID=UPI002672A877|nr:MULTISPECIES: hypothetical protein [unclassified Thermosynechococcus]MDR7898310.1 hypothetical protein [Thermosynechococcus sp. JY1332]MDR7905711.1 hypothetical protein [Thermosynechococcus sp. JY1334]WKT85448.1 hypothetical protein QYC30_08335 [Thermosynechococcus sp. JY1339]WNC54394.1 hypothetical protein RHJ31_08325 [Thermosynechococcus sp. JY1331]WNC59332.1 hypothetical protein RHJ80_07560 [Thermosynechococcus sp. QS41]
MKITQIRQSQLHSAEQGLTLAECIVAILLVNVAVAALVAPLMLVAATRVQNDRISQASALALSEVDRMRVLMEQGVNVTTAVIPPPSSVTASLGQPELLSNQPPPTTVVTCTGGGMALPTSATEGCLRVFNNREFVVQIYRGSITFGPNNRIVGYPMQVRVYNRATFTNGSPSTATPIGQQPATMTTSIGNLELPLAVITTDIVQGDSSTALCAISQCS